MAKISERLKDAIEREAALLDALRAARQEIALASLTQEGGEIEIGGMYKGRKIIGVEYNEKTGWVSLLYEDSFGLAEPEFLLNTRRIE